MRIILRIVCCVLLAFTAFSARAQWTYEKIREGSYFQTGLGGVIMPSFNLSSFAFGLNQAKTEVDPGFHLDLIGGYQFNQYIAAEINTGFLWNRVDTVGGLPVEPDRLDLWQTPLMANVVFTLPIKGCLNGYVGGGAGGVFTTFDLRFFDFGSAIDTDTAFGYQAFAGFRYAFDGEMDAGVSYKFMGTQSHEWSDRGLNFSSDATYSHSILATFTVRF